MSGELEKAQDVFLQKINRVCRDFGLNNIMAQLYAILYFSSKPLSLDDMVERLKISKGSVSINIRALEQYGAVRKVWVKGSRRDYYEAEMNISKVLTDRVKSMAQNRLSDIKDMISSSYAIANAVNPSSKEEKIAADAFKQKLDKLQSLQNKLRSLLDLVNSGFLGNMLSGDTEDDKKDELPQIVHGNSHISNLCE